jgi:hypothetical protein
MDAQRSGEAMTDPAIDREIQAALAVDPSPEFLARVRTQVAAEPPGITTWLSWKLVAAAVMAAIVTAVVLMSGPREKTGGTATAQGDIPLTPEVSIEQPRGPERSRASADSTHRPVEAPDAQGRSSTLRLRSAPAPSETRLVATKPAEPEILVDPREARAMRLLIRATRDGSLDLSVALRATTPTVMELPPIAAIVIAPLFIDPLTPSGVEGVRP